MQIIPMEARHLDALAEIERLCFPVPWSAEQLREELGGNLFLVAEDETGVLGYAGCQVVLDEGYITNVAVHPRARRRGTARALLERLQADAVRRELAFLTLEVRASNAPAIALYEGAGYQSVGIRRGFYREPKEDAVLMTLFLKA